MNIKRRLPLISLSIVSILVCLGSFAAIFVLSVDAKTIAEKIQSALTLGVPSALLFIVVLWLGAGIDHLLVRIQKASTRRIVSLLTYVIAPFTLCIGLPAIVILLFTGALFPDKGWQELPALPSPALEVVSAGDSSVYVRTESGQYYYCWFPTPERCWQDADPQSDPIIQNSINNVKELQQQPEEFPPRGEVKDLRAVTYSDMGNEVHVYYAVLDDGSVWVFESGADDYETGFATGLFGTIALIPAVIGLFIIYLGAGISALSRRFAAQPTGVSES